MGTLNIGLKYVYDNYITLSIAVVSGAFCGQSSFCIDYNAFQKFIDALTKMYNELNGNYEVQDYDSDDFLKFSFGSLGHLTISGQVGGSYSEQYLRYSFSTDQTYLKTVITGLKRILTEIKEV